MGSVGGSERGPEELQPEQSQRMGLGHLPLPGRKEGEGSRKAPKEAGTKHPRPGPWLLQCFREEGLR